MRRGHDERQRGPKAASPYRAPKERILSGQGWISLPEWDFRHLVDRGDALTLSNFSNNSDDDLILMYRRRVMGSFTETQSIGDLIGSMNVGYLRLARRAHN